MSDRLQPILQATRQDLVAKKLSRKLTQLESDLAAGQAPPRRDFIASLRNGAKNHHLAVIAEIKKNSPSQGAISGENMNVAGQAQAYQAGGADCLSILTEPHYFKGKLADMQDGRAAVHLPVLRKDFMVDAWQLAESRLAGADCALLIVAALGDETAPMHQAARDYGLDVLVEVHNQAELDIALKANAQIIGVNNRNLTDFSIDLAVAESLRPHIPSGVIAIAESGLEKDGDYLRMRDAGYDAVLVGTSLMKAGDPALRLKKIFASLAES
ncbi:MAG: indole-3-glycerol phosphate synthase TrpC [Candidatus Symbiobacter sp.]|nr:indole-3-glycerol phosphate synthase TrpC [Candidatus Symbiobacter sp.]